MKSKVEKTAERFNVQSPFLTFSQGFMMANQFAIPSDLIRPLGLEAECRPYDDGYWKCHLMQVSYGAKEILWEILAEKPECLFTYYEGTKDVKTRLQYLTRYREKSKLQRFKGFVKNIVPCVGSTCTKR